MVKTSKRDHVSTNSGSKSAFRKALKAVLSKNGSADRTTTTSRGSARRTTTKATGKISCRSSPGIISDFFSGLEDQQRGLLHQMGFGPLSRLKIYKLNKPLGAWLLSKLDPVSGRIQIGAKSSINLTCENTGLTLGIPYKGKEITASTPKEVATMKKYICSVFGKDKWEEITIHGLFQILERKPEAEMSAEEIIQFKMAFIICTVTKLLAPISLNNHISTRYIKALIDTDNISQYNWAKFVIDELKLAAVSLQEKVRRGKGAGYINGCIILLQILYLDSLDFGPQSLPHDCFPRIGAYTDEIVSELEKADIVLPNRFPFPTYGKHKLRDPRQSCYAHDTFGPQTEVSPHTPSEQGVCKHTLDLNPVSADTPSAIQVSSDSQSPEEARLKPRSIMGISPPSFSLGLTQMFDESPEHHVQANLNRDFEMVAAREAVVPDTPPEKQGRSNTANAKDTLTSPHSILKEVNGVKIWMREEYGVTKYPPKYKRKIIGQPGDMLAERPKRAIKPSKAVVSPFICNKNQIVRRDDKAAQELFNQTLAITDEESLNKIWVHISKPVPMSLKLQDIQQALGYDSEMPDETFNVAVQALFEDELQRFGQSEFLGWRHYINQDFEMYAVSEEGLWNAEEHIHLFSDNALLPYDVSKSKMIFIPVHEPDRFVLYAFDMENKKVCVLDPLKRDSQDSAHTAQRYDKTKTRISIALQECFQLAFPDWSEQIPTWELQFPPELQSVANNVDTAYSVLNCMRNWDGTRLVNPMPKDPQSMRKEFLLNLLSFKSNEAILPVAVQNIVNATNRS